MNIKAHRADQDPVLRGLDFLVDHPRTPRFIGRALVFASRARVAIDGSLDQLDGKVAHKKQAIEERDGTAADRRTERLTSALHRFREHRDGNAEVNTAPIALDDLPTAEDGHTGGEPSVENPDQVE